MRTIKFRGYSKDFTENEWFFGNLIDKGNGSFQILEKNPKIWDLSYDGITVIPESIGQFTGLHDKNGKEIYEGDLLGYWTKDVNKKDKLLLCRVSFINGAFVADISKNLDGKLITDLSSYLDEYVVVGNIHENPELISKTATHEH